MTTIRIGNVTKELDGKPFAIGVDTFDNSDWLYDDKFETDEEAIAFVQKEGKKMLKTHAYNKDGKHIGEGGEF